MTEPGIMWRRMMVKKHSNQWYYRQHLFRLRLQTVYFCINQYLPALPKETPQPKH